MQGEVILERNNKTYRPGEVIVGHVRLANVPSGLQHNSVLIIVEGIIKGRKSSKTPESEAIVAQAPPQIVCNYKETILQAGKFTRTTVEIPFGVTLQPIKGQTLLESYTGVYISVKYAVTAIVEVKGGAKAPSNFTTAFLVEVPGQGSSDRPADQQPTPFKISPSTLDNPQRLSDTTHFAMEGTIKSDCLSMDESFEGYVCVKDADQPLRSIDLQMIRIETIRGGEQQLKKATEILNLQMADGNVRRNSLIPVYMGFPKQFSCPTTYYKHFKIEFEVNLLFTFQNGLLITKNFPIRLYR